MDILQDCYLLRHVSSFHCRQKLYTITREAPSSSDSRARISTVGFGDITPHTQIGKLLFILDAVSGINAYIYLITIWQSSLVEERLERRLWKITESKANANPGEVSFKRTRSDKVPGRGFAGLP
jgi:hypothetical protein